MPPRPRPPHDPFTDAPLRANNSHATSGTTSSNLRNQASQTSLRSNTSTAAARTRQRGDLFAPSLSRRPTSRSTPRLEDGVLADPDSAEELAVQRQRYVKRGSPETKHVRLRPRQEDEPQDIVNKQPDGSYIAGLLGESHGMVPTVMTMEMEAEEEQRILDAQYADMARQYFTSGATLGGRGSKKLEEDFENTALPMSMRLRDQAMRKIEEERWMFAATDQYQTRLH